MKSPLSCECSKYKNKDMICGNIVDNIESVLFQQIKSAVNYIYTSCVCINVILSGIDISAGQVRNIQNPRKCTSMKKCQVRLMRLECGMFNSNSLG